MNEHFDNLFLIVLGVMIVLTSTYIAEFSRQYRESVCGIKGVNMWFDRIGFILAGLLFIFFGIDNW